jgi:hypothetical protein
MTARLGSVALQAARHPSEGVVAAVARVATSDARNALTSTFVPVTAEKLAFADPNGGS